MLEVIFLRKILETMKYIRNNEELKKYNIKNCKQAKKNSWKKTIGKFTFFLN